jgi:hypothetical protein
MCHSESSRLYTGRSQSFKGSRENHTDDLVSTYITTAGAPMGKGTHINSPDLRGGEIGSVYKWEDPQCHIAKLCLKGGELVEVIFIIHHIWLFLCELI